MKMLRNLSVRIRLLLIFALVAFGFFAGVLIGDRVSARMHENAVDIYDHAVIPIGAVGDIMRGIHDARGQLLLGLQHDPAGEWAKLHDHPLDRHLAAYDATMATVQETHAGYARRSAMSPAERQLIDEIGTALATYHGAGSEVTRAFRDGDFRGANGHILRKINPSLGALDKKVRELERLVTERSKRQNEENGVLRVRLSAAMWAGTLAGIVMLAIMYFTLARSINRPLAQVSDVMRKVAEGDLTSPIDVREGGNEFDAVLRSLARMQASLRDMTAEMQRAAGIVSQNAQTLSSRIDDSARRSDVQSERILAVTTTLQQMSSAIEEVSGGVRGVNEATNRARDLATSGADNMDSNLKTVDRIVDIVRDSSTAIQELCDTTQHVRELAGMIKDIAGQTNLLALNAAIEAARAGEQGRGFAVVADEVRKLAERTTKSSIGIGELLESVGQRSDQAIESMRQVMSDVEQGAEQTREIGVTLRHILEAAHEMSRLTQEIAGATVQQTEASCQTVTSMQDISEITERNNAAIQEVAVTASEMSELANHLQGLVGRFRFAA